MKKCLKIVKENCPSCGEQADRVGYYEVRRQAMKFIGLMGWRCDCGFGEGLDEERIMSWKRNELVVSRTPALFQL